MNNDEIRNEILAKLTIEREVREQLARQQADEAKPTKKSRWAWLESKLGLLVIGAIVSGVLVPVFQYTQERVKWHQQNRYNSLVLQLTNMRESLKQFIAVQALSAELYELGLDVLQARGGAITETQVEQWRKDLRALQQRRIAQNAAFAASVFYFPPAAQPPIRKEWQELIGQSEEMQGLIYGAMQSGPKATEAADANELATQLGERLNKVNHTYERLLTMLRQQLLEVENESSEFK
jgi:hypothetical protein